MSDSSADGPGSAVDTGLHLPAKATVLVPETTGTADADLPNFTALTNVYTIHTACTGKGKTTIIDRNDPDSSPIRINCNRPIVVGSVYIDTALQSLAVRIRGGSAAWKVAVVSGAHDL
ncbi:MULTISPECIES: hypothetical protein [unclassified Streptomyces]|uniref:hypothetical protein n=1 Tax=unclassified Streptomyces TaxID=2593676 RepID=UPI002E27C493|nr:hypothetical protein [Streptomyces sp. NBC_00223]